MQKKKLVIDNGMFWEGGNYCLDKSKLRKI